MFGPPQLGSFGPAAEREFGSDARATAVFAEVVELVEVELECMLVPAKLAPERPKMVEAARHQGREPSARFILCLVELHRQIDIADLERAARIGAEDPDLAHPR
jgi:hypothetical protein